MRRNRNHTKKHVFVCIIMFTKDIKKIAMFLYASIARKKLFFFARKDILFSYNTRSLLQKLSNV